MGTTSNAAAQIRATLKQQGRSYAGLSRTTGIAYKTLLAEVKHESRPLGLENALRIAPAIGKTLPELVAA